MNKRSKLSREQCLELEARLHNSGTIISKTMLQVLAVQQEASVSLETSSLPATTRKRIEEKRYRILKALEAVVANGQQPTRRNIAQEAGMRYAALNGFLKNIYNKAFAQSLSLVNELPVASSAGPVSNETPVVNTATLLEATTKRYSDVIKNLCISGTDISLQAIANKISAASGKEVSPAIVVSVLWSNPALVKEYGLEELLKPRRKS